MAKPASILIIEDNPADVLLIRRAIAGAGLNADLFVVKDGEQATQFFDQSDADDTAPCPDLVLLDINLPKKQGGEVLAHMRKSARCADSPVIVVSTSDSARERQLLMELGAKRYFRKPSDYAEFMKLGDLIKNVLAGL